ncbi:MAG TPA: flagellar hook-length control protein FliK [Sulfurospirillum arcachonense]|nr:flagellar hook-length control protein FliK [Sulfurospirillum arcachonense]HIP44370.1 flagellar hook-length control protein FliK [Sulfurospirillum arcachonense]
MRISTKALFNLISKTDDKNIKDALQKIVSNKDELLKPNVPSSSKKADVKVLINQLLKELSSNIKTKENTLQEIKQSDIPKLMKNTTSELKTLINLIKTDKTLSKFAPLLEKILLHVKDIKPETFKQELAKSGTLMESKLSTQKTQTMPIVLKEVLTNIKELLVKSSPKEPLHVKLLDTLLNTKKVDKSFVQTLENLLKEIKNSPNLPKQINPLLKKLDVMVQKSTLPKEANVKEVLTDIKQLLAKEPKPSALHVKSIDKILEAPKADKGFINDIKTLISDIKQSKGVDKPVVQIVAKLEELVQKSTLVESKIQNNPKVMPKEVSKVVEQIKQVLVELKELAQSSKKEPILEPKSQEIVKLVEQTLKTQEFFSRELSKATISEKLQQVVNLIKSELVKSDVKTPLHVEVAKLTNKLEAVVKEQIATKQIVPNQKLLVDTPIKLELANDIKSTLLNIKQELSTQTSPVTREISFQVDRLINQIEYFQLLSLSSNTQSSYLPFLWDGLEEGQVSLKKLKENRFFCEINLKLKEYGKIDLMLMLFEDVHLNISVFAEKKEFLELVQENLPLLKQGINKIGLIPSTVQLKKRELKDETMNSSNFLGTGLNIEV